MTREEAIEWLEDIKDVGCETMFRDWIYEVAIDKAIEALSADTVEVVRCKDCYWYKKPYCDMHNGEKFNDNDFCSYGERSDNANTD